MTGVQTCALPISMGLNSPIESEFGAWPQCTGCMAGMGALVVVIVLFAVTICDAIGRLFRLFTNASEGGTRVVDADVSKNEDSRDVGRSWNRAGATTLKRRWWQ